MLARLGRVKKGENDIRYCANWASLNQPCCKITTRCRLVTITGDKQYDYTNTSVRIESGHEAN